TGVQTCALPIYRLSIHHLFIENKKERLLIALTSFYLTSKPNVSKSFNRVSTISCIFKPKSSLGLSMYFTTSDSEKLIKLSDPDSLCFRVTLITCPESTYIKPSISGLHQPPTSS